jgi:hypothetical protein
MAQQKSRIGTYSKSASEYLSIGRTEGLAGFMGCTNNFAILRMRVQVIRMPLIGPEATVLYMRKAAFVDSIICFSRR